MGALQESQFHPKLVASPQEKAVSQTSVLLKFFSRPVKAWGNSTLPNYTCPNHVLTLLTIRTNLL
jgi:hypothetical protein